MKQLKKAMRGAVRDKRNALTAYEIDSHSSAVSVAVRSLPEYSRAAVVMCYASFGSEVSTWALMKQILADGKRLIVPRMTREPGVLELCPVTDVAGFVPGTWGIMEPLPCLPGTAAAPEDPDLILMPGVAFDLRCNRLGYGGGYFDRMLPVTRPDCVLVALAFETQIVQEVPCEHHDIRMDCVVTEKRIIRPDAG